MLTISIKMKWILHASEGLWAIVSLIMESGYKVMVHVTILHCVTVIVSDLMIWMSADNNACNYVDNRYAH